MAVGATGDEELAREAGRVTAREVGAIGFRFMGSPVVDINRPSNPIVSTRAYGEEPDAVSRMALAYAAGVQSEGVIACLSTFPARETSIFDAEHPATLSRAVLTGLLRERMGFRTTTKGPGRTGRRDGTKSGTTWNGCSAGDSP